LHIDTEKVPLFEGAFELAELGCIPGACFRNMEFSENDIEFSEDVSYEHKMLMMDAQTSGGLLICCPAGNESKMILEMKEAGYFETKIIGNVKNFTNMISLFFM
jgi:selenide,water dikinase